MPRALASARAVILEAAYVQDFPCRTRSLSASSVSCSGITPSKTVDLVEIDVVSAEPAQACVAAFHDVLAG